MEPQNLACRSLVIAGLGLRSAVGLTAASSIAAVRAGISRLEEHPYMLDKAGEPMVVAREPTLDPMLQDAQRFALLAKPALEEALAPLVACDVKLSSVDIMLGIPEPRPGVPSGLERALGTMVRQTTGARVSFFPHGNAAGFLAMARACQSLLDATSAICLVGGVDSYLTAETLEWMDELCILKSGKNRNGFPPGEAAGFCLLMSAARATHLGLPPLGQIVSVAWAREPSPIRTRTICVGRGLSDAIQGATKALRLPDERVDDTICDLNGEPYRSEEFALTVLRTQRAFVDAARFKTPTDCWGDVGAACAPLFAALAVAAGQGGYARGPRTLLWASSVGGERGTAIIRAEDGQAP